MKYRLSVHSFRKGCEGNIGDVIDVSEADAAYLDSFGAGKRLEQATNRVAESALEEAAAKPGKFTRQVAENKAAANTEKR